jgi:Tfp pilus assembly protein PilX
MNIFTSQKNTGYTLLFAVLVTAIVLSVAISILSISRKEFLLSTSARESQFAFYAADSGMECAAYNDLVGGIFSSTTTFPTEISCANASSTIPAPIIVASSTNPNITNYTFIWSGKLGVSQCFSVDVTKQYDTSAGRLAVTTLIGSRGYNVGWNTAIAPPDCSAVNPKKVERKLLLVH